MKGVFQTAKWFQVCKVANLKPLVKTINDTEDFSFIDDLQNLDLEIQA